MKTLKNSKKKLLIGSLIIIALLFSFRSGFSQSTEVLPVTLSSFTALPRNSTMILDWKFSEELNATRYEIQRSTTGNDFTTIGNIASTGNHVIGSSYSWTDPAPVVGISFYRLKMIDKNNAFSLSKIIKAEMGMKAGSVSIYPNPVVGNTVNIQLNNIDRGSYPVTISNMQGQVVYNKTLTHHGGTDAEKLELSNNLAHGTYLVRMGDYTMQVVKL
jgi:hypothetical protein